MTIMSGVPVGAQIAWLSSKRPGWPATVTRVAAVTNCAVTQGPFAAGGGGSAQPATRYGEAIVTTGWPDTTTRGFGVTGVACPACEHKTVAPRCNKKPGISYTITIAPLLIVTVGPVMMMLAPLPFWM